MPDFKTFANFRKDNGRAIRNVCRQFVVLCQRLDLFTQAIVAIDGSKFKAVNNRDRDFTRAKIAAPDGEEQRGQRSYGMRIVGSRNSCHFLVNPSIKVSRLRVNRCTFGAPRWRRHPNGVSKLFEVAMAPTLPHARLTDTILALASNLGSKRMRLNLGCGRSALAGWVNVDAVGLPGVDVVADLDHCRDKPMPFPDDAADEFLLAHVIEHLADPLGLMQELHRIARSGAKATIRCPYGASDDADEDPTHRRRMFLQSFGYFSQPYYWRADYGYRGDWDPKRIVLVVDRATYSGIAPSDILLNVHALRNVVLEMVAELAAVKPIRAPDRALQRPPLIEIAYA
jgi:SAM-dependent methyltransferase